MKTAADRPNQTTFDGLPGLLHKPSGAEEPSEKQIVISELDTQMGEDVLAVKIGFRLIPSRAAYSKITLDLHFDGHKISSTRIGIPQGQLATEDFEFTSVLDMRGIGAGLHLVKVDMCEAWSSGKILTFASKKVSVDYVPIKRQERFIRVPTVKSIAGADLAVETDVEKVIHQDIEENMKKELTSIRDEW